MNKQRIYTTPTVQSEKIDPSFITGFTDAEGCFIISILKNYKLKTGWTVKLSFQIGLLEKDRSLLQQIQLYLNVGNISKEGSQKVHFRVESVKDLPFIIKHFDKYPLITQKLGDYELFKQAFTLIQNKEHLTPEGLVKIVAIKASMNWGLSEQLKIAFPNIIPVPRPSVVDIKIKDPNWIAGFASGEGCFFIGIMSSVTNCLGYRVKLIFQLTQNSRDEQLMRILINYFNCGNVYKKGERGIDFKVTKFDDLIDKIIPFLQKYQVIGVKSKDFADFCKAAELIKNKDHLTTSGLDQIRKIKSGMNRGRR